ncbi:MAG: leucine-rich repeat domain-containing protein [Clostridia bacterium]|nr:leucine-rich repeat domain-containing protein [Clostridia bacterium]
MKNKILSVIMMFVIILLNFSAISVLAATHSGSCGESLSWELEDDGTLSISGSGDMKTFYYNTSKPPWYSYRSKIKNVFIGKGVTSIGNYAFVDCTSLKSVTISDTVTTIGDYAFDECSSLANVKMGNSVKSIGKYAFDHCACLTAIDIPIALRFVGSQAFAYCTGLTRVNITDMIPWFLIEFTDNASNPLFYAKNLYLNGKLITEDVVVPNGVTTISAYAFYNCDTITSVTIPKSVTSIDMHAFQNCTGLTSITIPDSVTSIGYCAFGGCTGLTSITIPDSVTTIGSGAFSSTGYAKNADNWENDALYIGKHLTSVKGTIDGDYVVKEGTYTIADLAFANRKITGVTIPESVKFIGAEAFRYCSALKSVVIGNGVTSIGDYAFANCTGLTSVTMGINVKYIGNQAFYCCTALARVNITDLISWLNIDFETIELLGYAQKLYLNGSLLTNLVIPAGVTAVGGGSFYNCKDLTSVTIPDSVKSIGSSAFRNCSGLTSVTIPDGVKSIGHSAFDSCSGIKSITIPNSVTSIGDNAFYSCTGLTSVTLSNSLTSIGKSVFSSCSGIKSIAIPDHVTSIGEYAFSDCTSLTSVVVGKSVKSISNKAFFRCTGLAKVTMPRSVESISSNAFEQSASFTMYGCPGTYAERYAAAKSIPYVATGTKTDCTTAADGKVTLAAAPSNLSKGARVIIVCYKNGKAVDFKCFENKNETMNFVTAKKFDTAKVFVWESFKNIKPFCESEVILPQS